MTRPLDQPRPKISTPSIGAIVSSSAAVTGSRSISPEDIDRAFGMPVGKLRSRAGIVSLSYVSDEENELTLGAKAAHQALQAAHCRAQELDWIIATSETHHDYPSLAAQLHTHLKVRENCSALDVGGACLGLLNAFAVAQALLISGQASTVAVITADVHSRTLTPDRVAGEFGGLFGDGASAFILRADSAASPLSYRLGEFLFGCVGKYAAAISVKDSKDGGLSLRFDGEALSRAAITRMEETISAIEARSGISRASLAAFATHQPNPRLVSLLAKQCGIAPEKFPAIARTSGNLGSSTCGAALHAALEKSSSNHAGKNSPIFVVSLGPGLIYGGTWLASP